MEQLQHELLERFPDQLFNKEQSSEESIRALNFILFDDRKLLDSAVDVLDNLQYIDRCKSSSTTRHFCIVPGSKGANYLCLNRYCTCPRFTEISKHPTKYNKLCKHLVAIKLAEVFGLIKEKV